MDGGAVDPATDGGAVDPATVPIREAATVVLVRDARGGGLEVFLQHRVDTMIFAPGMAVFPGGGVDGADRRSDAGWLGPEAPWWGAAFGVEPERAVAAVRAAIRELFEETGVLLAVPVKGAGPAGTPGEAERRALEARTTDLDAVLGRAGLVADCRHLRPWDRWTTPVGPPRRYDTLFFLTVAAAGMSPDGRNTESRSSGWHRPADALAAAGTTGPGLLPPTRAVLTDLAGFGSVAELPAAGRSVVPGGNQR